MGTENILSTVEQLLCENNKESFRKALDSLIAIEKTNTHSASYWDWRSRCHLCLKDRDAADDAFKKFMILSLGRISFVPSNDILLIEYPLMIARLGGRKEAEALLSRFHSQKTNNVKLTQILSKFYKQNDSPELALKVIEESSLLKKDVSLKLEFADTLVELGRQKDALKILKDALKQNKDNPSLHLAIGRLHLSKKEFKEAEKEFKKAVELDSTDANHLHYYGLTLYFQKKYQKAKEIQKQGIQIDDSRLDIWNSLAAVHVELDEFDEAETVFRHIIEKWPDVHQTYSNLGVLYQRSGMSHKTKEWNLKAAQVALERSVSLLYKKEFAECIKMCQEALEYNPKSSKAYAISGIVMLEIMEFEQAKTLIEKASELDPECSEALAAKSYFELAHGRFNRAERFALQALDLNPDSSEALIVLAILNNERDEFANSEKFIRKAMDLIGPNVATTIQLVKSLLGQHKFAESLEALSDAIYENPWDAGLWFAFYITLEIMGDSERAIVARQRALEIDPDIEKTISSFKLEQSNRG